MLYNKTKKYNKSGVYPFHMPGHKRQSIVPELPYELDMTEIEGFDNLHNPKTCIKEIEDRAAEIGDTVVFDFEGFTDGVPFEGGKGTDHELTLGSGSFIPGFEEQIAGHTLGEEFEVNVTFPEEYHAADLAGKPAVFKCTLKSLKQLPALDDEFAKDVSEDCETLADLKKSIKAVSNQGDSPSFMP